MIARTLQCLVVCYATAGYSYAHAQLRDPNASIDWAAVRRHIINTLTDAEIRSLRAQAEAKHNAWLAQREAARKQSELAAIQRARDCQDFVYRQRNPSDCQSTGIYLGSPDMPASLQPTVESEFDRMLLARCVGVRTVNEARQKNCLP